MSLEAPPSTPPFPYIKQLFKKAVIQWSKNLALPGAYANARKLYEWNKYIISVLEAPYRIRVAVRAKAVELMDTSAFQTQLAILLTAYELLSPDKKREFIWKFKGSGTAAQQVPVAVATATTHQPGHQPPQFEP